jgi:hypothetical protein
MTRWSLQNSYIAFVQFVDPPGGVPRIAASSRARRAYAGLIPWLHELPMQVFGKSSAVTSSAGQGETKRRMKSSRDGAPRIFS